MTGRTQLSAAQYRTLYAMRDADPAPYAPASPRVLLSLRGLGARGHAEPGPDGWVLTAKGRAEAVRPRVLKSRGHTAATQPPIPSLPGEQWRPLAEAQVSHYLVSNLGRLCSPYIQLRPTPTPASYGGCMAVKLLPSGGGKRWQRSLGPLVLTAFGMPRPSPGRRVRWADGDLTNCALSNLSWEVIEAGAPPPRLPARPDENHVTALLRNRPWAAAHAAVPRHLPPDVRADVIAEMVLAHLTGELQLQDIPRRAPGFVRAHYRGLDWTRLRSLDAVIPGTDGLRLIDTLAAP